MKKIIITGNVGRDSELRADQAGNQFATFSVGISVGTKQNPKTDWVEVSCNGKLADVAKSYVKKGTKVLVEGFPSAAAYLNRDNKPTASLRVYANVLELLSRKEDSPNASDDFGAGESVYTLPESRSHDGNGGGLATDDIPF